MRTGTIDLSSVRYITGVVPKDGKSRSQFLSADLSGDTTFYLEFSLDGSNWDIAEESGLDVSDTLVQSETKIFVYESDPDMLYRIRFDGATTGNVAYILSDGDD